MFEVAGSASERSSSTDVLPNDGVGRQKGRTASVDRLRLVLEEIMAGLGEIGCTSRRGKPPHPLVQEVVVEDEILHSPEDEHRDTAQQGKPIFDPRDKVVAAVAGRRGNVLHEPEDGDAVLQESYGAT